VLVEILNVVQVFTPAQELLLFVTLVTVVQQKLPKTRVTPEKTWGFPGIFGYYPHWTPEIVVGHWQAFLIVVQPA